MVGEKNKASSKQDFQPEDEVRIQGVRSADICKGFKITFKNFFFCMYK